MEEILLQVNRKLESSEVHEEIERLRTEVGVVRSSIRYRLGSLLVDAAKSAKSLRRLPAQLLHLWYAAHIDASLITELPPVFIDDDYGQSAQMRQLARLASHVRRYEPSDRTSGILKHIADTADDIWLARTAQCALELDQCVRNGFPLPSPKGRAGDSVANTAFYLLHYDPRAITNGYTRRTHEILTALPSTGWTVLPIIRPSLQAPGQPNLAPYEGIGYMQLPLSRSWAGGLAEYIDEYGEGIVRVAAQRKPRIIHAASNFINGLAGATAARKLGVPFVYEARGFWEVTRATEYPSFRRSLGYRAQASLELMAARAADAVITLNEELSQQLQSRGLDPQLLTIAPSGAPVMAQPTPERQADVRQQLGLPSAFVVGYIGSLVRYEGLETLLHAAARLAPVSPVHVLLVGDGAISADLKHLAHRLGIRNSVTFAGRVEPDMAKTAYQALDIAIYARGRCPVTELVGPLKHLEALAAGIPVIVSDVAPLRRFADATNLVTVVPPDNAEALARAITDLKNAPNLRKELSERGRVWATEKGSWKRTADVIAETYQRL